MPSKSAIKRTSAGEALTELVGEVFRLNAAFLQAGNDLTEPFGLTSARWQLLAALFLQSERITVSELARKMKLTRQSVQKIVNGLVAKNILEMLDNPQDQRAKWICFTANGRNILKQVSCAQAGWVNSLSDTLNEQEISVASDLLKHIRAILADSETPEPLEHRTILVRP